MTPTMSCTYPFHCAPRKARSTRSPRLTGLCERWRSRYGTLLLFFLHIPPLRPGLLDNLLLQLPRDHIVVMHFHIEAAAALGHGGEVNSVGQHFRHGHFGLDHGVAAFVVHALNAAAARVQVAHN